MGEPGTAGDGVAYDSARVGCVEDVVDYSPWIDKGIRGVTLRASALESIEGVLLVVNEDESEP